MRKLLEEFWYGNIFPQEQYAAQHPDIKPLLRLVEKNKTKKTTQKVNSLCVVFSFAPLEECQIKNYLFL